MFKIIKKIKSIFKLSKKKSPNINSDSIDMSKGHVIMGNIFIPKDNNNNNNNNNGK